MDEPASGVGMASVPASSPPSLPAHPEPHGLGRWLLKHQVDQVEGPEAIERPDDQHAWWRVFSRYFAAGQEVVDGGRPTGQADDLPDRAAWPTTSNPGRSEHGKHGPRDHRQVDLGKRVDRAEVSARPRTSVPHCCCPTLETGPRTATRSGRRGLAPADTARAAVKEFGTAGTVATAFRAETQRADTRRLGWRLLFTGP